MIQRGEGSLKLLGEKKHPRTVFLNLGEFHLIFLRGALNATISINKKGIYIAILDNILAANDASSFIHAQLCRLWREVHPPPN